MTDGKSGGAEELHLFLDTNVLLHYDALDGIVWRDHVPAERICLRIAQSVLDEISALKDMGETKWIRKRAGRVAKRLLDCLDGDTHVLALRDGELLLLEADTPRMEEFPRLNSRSKDDRLLAAALTLARSEGVRCYVVTGDSSLGLRVKIQKWNLRHIPAPEAHRLPPEADEAERENAALRKELAQVRAAQPKLSLSFLDEQTRLNFRPKHRDIEALITELTSEHRAKMKPLPVRDPDDAFKGIAARMAGINAKECRDYNSALPHYFIEHEKWLRRCVAVQNRTVRIALKVSNDGNAPADSVHVKLHFPDGLDLIEAEDLVQHLPRPPKAPEKPGHLRAMERLSELNSNMGGLSAFRAAAVGPAREAISIKKTNSYDVEWVTEKLRQRSSEPLDELAAIMEPECGSFHIGYEVRADNLADVVTGQLHVIIPHEAPQQQS